MTRYWCYFEFKDDNHVLFADRLDAFKDGFWLTKEPLILTQGSNAHYWIPPHKIKYIEKEQI